MENTNEKNRKTLSLPVLTVAKPRFSDDRARIGVSTGMRGYQASAWGSPDAKKEGPGASREES